MFAQLATRIKMKRKRKRKEEFGARLDKLKDYRKVFGVRLWIVPVFARIFVCKICSVSGIEPMTSR